MDQRQKTGATAEALAARHLQRAGYTILEQNWRCRVGELDLIARRGDVLVFVEVRSATTDFLDSPAMTVDAAKQARVARTADAWLQRNGVPPRVRFDVIGVVFRHFRRPRVRHFEDAFTAPWAF